MNIDQCTHEDLDRGWDLHFRAERKAHILTQNIELLDTRLDSLKAEIQESEDTEGQSLAEVRSLMQQLQAARNHSSQVELNIQVEEAAVRELGTAVATANKKRKAALSNLEKFQHLYENFVSSVSQKMGIK